MTADDIATAMNGVWNVLWKGGNSGTMTISSSGGKPQVRSQFRAYGFKTLEINGNNITINADCFVCYAAIMRGKLVAPNHMEGVVTFDGSGPLDWTADKQ